MSLNIGDGSVTTTRRPGRFHVPHLDVLPHLASWEAFGRLTGGHAELGHLAGDDSVLVCLIVAGRVEIVATHQAHLDLLVCFIVVQLEVIDQVLHIHRVLVGCRTHHSDVVRPPEEFRARRRSTDSCWPHGFL